MLGKKARSFCVFLLLAVFLTLPLSVRAGVYEELPEIDIQAKAAILVYAGTGEILYSHNIHIQRPPASLTKLLTCLLAAELGDPDEPVTVEEGDFFDITADGSNVGLRAGDTLSLRDLLYASMLSSANEACNAIARHIAGSVPAFLELMNGRLAALGCENSRFANTHGLPADDHYTSVYDMSLLVAACLENKLLLDIAKTVSYSLPPTGAHSEGQLLRTTNNLLMDRAVNGINYYYEPALGLKTGSTSAAGYCLASYAKRKGDNRVLIAVVMGASKEEDGTLRHFTETKALYEWGYANFTVKTLVANNELVAGIPVRLGVGKDMLYLTTNGTLEALVPAELKPEDLTRTTSLLYPDGVEAPVIRGAPMGTMSVSYQGKEFGTVELVAGESIEKDSGEEMVENLESLFSKTWLRAVLIGLAVLVLLYIIFVFTLNNLKKRKRRPPGNYRGKRRRRW